MPEEKTSRSNIAARIAGVGVIALAAIAINSGWLKSGNLQPSRVNNDYIEQETAKLVGKPRTITLTVEKAIAARNAIRKGDYAAARKIADDVLAHSQLQYWHFYPFDRFMYAISQGNDPAFLENLNKWIEKDKGYPIAYLIRAEYYYKVGWEVRGHKYVSQTESGHIDSFSKYMEMAEADARKAIELDNKNPYSYLSLLNILVRYGNSQPMEDGFQEAIKQFPGYYKLYTARLRTLYPQWGGSPEEMYSFVNKYAGEAPANSPLKLLYLNLYNNLMGVVKLACVKAGDDGQKKCIASVMGQLISRELENNVHNALNLYNTTDKYQFSVAVEDILTDIVSTRGMEEYSGTLVHLTAQAMDSDNQLVKDNSKHNNYVMDKIAAAIWYNDRYYDNAEQKYKEALADIEYMDFPNDEEKYRAISEIYNDLARVYEGLSQYENTIIYQKASIATGGYTENGYRYSICFAYYKLKDYAQSVKECTNQLDNGEVMGARFWRGKSNVALGQTDEALKDFSLIADSEDGFRTSAAIEMSVIYGKRDDVKSSLDALNNHPYLFDEENQSKNDLMVSYNNRCYAYMKLGELQKALDDCNASLRFGNLPDAYQKQQELIKKINEQKNKI